ncbi:MAG: HlyD family efflux transporter periplasmic adaptor subunit, partial [Planctomycetales bacterium]|nr:HlyD family efflux transporter periplasmic adaptor subunit [Planctomycetales bacterium]
KRNREPGDVVAPGSPVLSLISTEELWISAWVDETQMSKLQVSQSARVLFRSNPDRSYAGQVARLGHETDRETREFIVDVRVLDLPTNWAVGQRAEVLIEVAKQESATLLPSAYLSTTPDGPGTFVAEQGRAQWRPIRTGLRNAELIEVIEGIKPGDLLVQPRVPRQVLRSGQKVVTP